MTGLQNWRLPVIVDSSGDGDSVISEVDYYVVRDLPNEEPVRILKEAVGDGFVRKCFESSAALHEALDASRLELIHEPSIVECLPPAFSKDLRNDSAEIRSAAVEQLVNRLSDPLQVLLQARVLVFVKKRQYLRYCLAKSIRRNGPGGRQPHIMAHSSQSGTREEHAVIGTWRSESGANPRELDQQAGWAGRVARPPPEDGHMAHVPVARAPVSRSNTSAGSSDRDPEPRTSGSGHISCLSVEDREDLIARTIELDRHAKRLWEMGQQADTAMQVAVFEMLSTTFRLIGDERQAQRNLSHSLVCEGRFFSNARDFAKAGRAFEQAAELLGALGEAIPARSLRQLAAQYHVGTCSPYHLRGILKTPRGSGREVDLREALDVYWRHARRDIESMTDEELEELIENGKDEVQSRS